LLIYLERRFDCVYLEHGETAHNGKSDSDICERMFQFDTPVCRCMSVPCVCVPVCVCVCYEQHCVDGPTVLQWSQGFAISIVYSKTFNKATAPSSHHVGFASGLFESHSLKRNVNTITTLCTIIDIFMVLFLTFFLLNMELRVVFSGPGCQSVSLHTQAAM
jgi:hypothetical protein